MAPTPYVTLADVIPNSALGRALSAMSDAEKQRYLDQANDFVDAHMPSQYTLPLTAWPTTLSRHAFDVFAWYAMRARGFAPKDASDDTFLQAYEQAAEFLDGVRRSRNIHGVVDSSPGTTGGAQVASNTSPQAVYVSSTGLPFVSSRSRRGI